ncbi:MAG: tetratricopeptide repeat protein [Methylophilaceae bacterium]|nr:tetratricopeptide repeat protein [Methyloradius sp.]
MKILLPKISACLLTSFLLIGFALQADADNLSDAKAAIAKGDFVKAAKIYQEAAQAGDVKAQYNLGLMYLSGDGVKQDNAEALKWFTASANGGFAEAQYRLGVIYFRNDIVPIDYAEAVKWYRAAATQGHVKSQLDMGVIYYSGAVVDQDYAEAIKWYKLAASQGLSEAQFNLGSMYLKGEGVSENLVKGYMWVYLSTLPNNAQLNEPARNNAKRVTVLNFFANKMTAEQVVEAKSLANACQANNFSAC